MNPLISRRRFLVYGGNSLLAAGIGGSLLAACTGSGEEESGGKSFSLWTWETGAPYTKWFQENIYGGFEKAYPGYNIDVIVKPSMGPLETALTAGQGPDAVPGGGPANVGQFVDNDWLLPLDSYSKQYGWDEKILGWALDSGKVGGQLYSLPVVWESFLILYNKKTFQENGWSVPTTREELEAIATEAMGRGIVPFSAGNGEFAGATEWFVFNFFNHYSGADALYQALTTELPFTDPVFVDAISMLNGWFQKGWLGGSVEKYFTNGFNEVYAALVDGTAAMDMEGTWAMPAMPEFFGSESPDWDWFPIPSLRDGVPFPLYELGIGETLSINAESKSADAVAKFLDWWFSQSKLAARKMADLSADPWPIPIQESDFPSNIDPRFRDQYLARVDATGAGNFGYTGYTFLPPKSYAYTFEEMEKVMTGGMTPAEYCQGLNDIFLQEYAEGKVPPIIPRESS